MKHGFVRVATATPEIRVADVDFNVNSIAAVMEEAVDELPVLHAVKKRSVPHTIFSLTDVFME